MTPRFRLGARGYGKDGIRSFTFRTGPAGDDVADLSVTTMLRGGIDEAYLAGDNARMVTSDAQRNVALDAVGRSFRAPVEEVARCVAGALRARYPQFLEVEVGVSSECWCASGGVFVQRDRLVHLARVVDTDGGGGVWSSLRGQNLLVPTGSRFVGFWTDDMTPNQPAADRPLAGRLEVDWVIDHRAGGTPDWAGIRTTVHDTILEGCGETRSESVQHLLATVGARVFEQVARVQTVTLRFESLSLTGSSDTGIEGPRTYIAGGSANARTEVTVARETAAPTTETAVPTTVETSTMETEERD